MLGREPCAVLFDSSLNFDPGSFQNYLKSKLAELRHFVESNLVKSAGHQNTEKPHYDKQLSFAVHDKVWFSVPTAGKLQPRNPVTIQINNGRNSKVIHSNRLRHCFQAALNNSESTVTENLAPSWTPPLVEHFIKETVRLPHCYPSRERQPPQFYRP